MKKILIVPFLLVIFGIVYFIRPHEEVLPPADWATRPPLSAEQQMAESCEEQAKLDRETTWSDKMKPSVVKTMQECQDFYNEHPEYNSYEIMKDACTNPVYSDLFGSPSADLKCESFK